MLYEIQAPVWALSLWGVLREARRTCFSPVVDGARSPWNGAVGSQPSVVHRARDRCRVRSLRRGASLQPPTPVARRRLLGPLLCPE